MVLIEAMSACMTSVCRLIRPSSVRAISMCLERLVHAEHGEEPKEATGGADGGAVGAEVDGAGTEGVGLALVEVGRAVAEIWGEGLGGVVGAEVDGAGTEGVGLA